MAENARAARLRAVRVQARGDEFRIVQLSGNLFVCARQHGSCCCGWEEKGRLPFEPSLWGDEWERRAIRNRVHLTFSGCLGPCAAGNNALLQLFGRSIWLKDLNDPALVPLVFDYIEAMLAENRVLPAPDELRDHVYDRYLPAPESDLAPLAESEEIVDALDRLDPVCLMEIDPATTRQHVEYDGRTIFFCAPSCRKAFLAQPERYLVG